jgi:hypothetical protein
MTDIHQMHEDLRFVREAVTRRDAAPRGPVLIYWVWAVYVLVGYTLLDVSPRAAGWFFAVGGVLGGVASAVIARRAAREAGEYDRAEARRSLLHWAGGGVLAVATPFALAAVIPALRGPAGGQLIAVNFGLVYFLAGAHFDRNFLWLGLVLIVGGVLVGLAPRYGWTTLGIIVALGLVVPTLFPPRRAPAPPQQPLFA